MIYLGINEEEGQSADVRIADISKPVTVKMLQYETKIRRELADTSKARGLI